jgi:hypothetical protein
VASGRGRVAWGYDSPLALEKGAGVGLVDRMYAEEGGFYECPERVLEGRGVASSTHPALLNLFHGGLF